MEVLLFGLLIAVMLGFVVFLAFVWALAKAAAREVPIPEAALAMESRLREPQERKSA